MTIPMTVSSNNETFKVSVSSSSVTIPVGFDCKIVYTDLPNYDGEYEFVPSSDRQVISTHDHSLLQDIVIDPIPDNYGRISWNGSVITVS